MNCEKSWIATFQRLRPCVVSYYFLAEADRVGRVEKLCGRRMLAAWQDNSTPSNFLYFLSKEKNTLCCDSKGLFSQKKRNQFLQMPALHSLALWLEIWNWNIMVRDLYEDSLGESAGGEDTRSSHCTASLLTVALRHLFGLPSLRRAPLCSSIYR